MLRQLWTIARGTFIEALRQPIFVVLLLSGMLLLALNPALSAFSFGEENKLLIDLGLSTIFVCGLLLAAFTAAGVLAGEIENKTVLTVISKPVSRPVWVAGKYLGVSAAVLVAFWIWSLVFLLSVRHGVLTHSYMTHDMPAIGLGLGAVALAFVLALGGNYFYGWVFPSTFTGAVAALLSLGSVLLLFIDQDWSWQSPATNLDGRLLVALLLALESLFVLCAVAIAASTRLGQVLTLIVCALVFSLGLFSEYVYHAAVRADNTPTIIVAYLGSILTPNMQFFWLDTAVHEQDSLDAAYVLLTTAYTMLYSFAVLCLGAALFQTRETS